MNRSLENLNLLDVVVWDIFKQNFRPRPRRFFTFGGGLIVVHKLKTDGVIG